MNIETLKELEQADKTVGYSVYDFVFDFSLDQTENAKCCPFPHYTDDGTEYYEDRPSMHVNIDKGTFHCKACNASGGEIGFVQQLFGTRIAMARILWRLFRQAVPVSTYLKGKVCHTQTTSVFEKLGVPKKLLKSLGIHTAHGFQRHMFPVVVHGAVLDVRSYCPKPPEGTPKMKGMAGRPNGLIWPYDRWRETNKDKWTIVCEGEKDALVAISRGLNAISLTGGAGATPILLSEFRGRKVAICYDNDPAGLKGAVSLAKALMPIAAQVRVITGFYKICKEQKEDLTDFFVKYKKDADLLKKIIIGTPDATLDYLESIDPELETEFSAGSTPKVTLEQASEPRYTDVTVRSDIMVVATNDTTFSCPSAAYILDKSTGKGYEWELKSNRPDRILELIGSNLPLNKVKQSLCKYAGVPMDTEDPQIEITQRRTIYQATITDLRTTRDDSTTIHEFVAFTFDQKLESGKAYTITYRLTPHPAKGQMLQMIIMRAVPKNTLDGFVIDDDVKNSLKKFQPINVQTQSEYLKGHIGYEGDNRLITLMNLTWHSLAEIPYGHEGNRKGMIDLLVISASRSGKSSTAKTLMNLYNAGAVVSMAGSAATPAGLVGGSSKSGGDSWQTRAGVIPQNNMGLIALEELGKAKEDLLSYLTDVRSSGQVRIARANGSISFPAAVRFVSMTNPKTISGRSKSITSYPNGVSILQELVAAQEDIARYDMIYIMQPTTPKPDLHWKPVDGWDDITVDDYQHRLKWVWTRTAGDVELTDEAVAAIEGLAEDLNTKLSCHVNIFSTETPLKLMRFATAAAALMCSTDDTFQKIIVKEEHVIYACKIMLSVYTSAEWKLDRYVQSERLFTETDDDAVTALQNIYERNPLFIMQLDNSADTTLAILESATGTERSELQKLVSRCTKLRFVRLHGAGQMGITPSERYRKTAELIDRTKRIDVASEKANLLAHDEGEPEEIELEEDMEV